MTTTDDPHHPLYLDEADVRGALTVAFDVCEGCRRCAEYCGAFPTLFDLLDRFGDRGAGNLTPDEQDRVVEGCFHCSACSIGCPYGPDRPDGELDLPRLMIRAEAMRVANTHTPGRQRLATRAVARTAVFGRPGRVVASLCEAALSAVAGSSVRRVVGSTFGVRSVRRLPSRTNPRLSRRLARRRPAAGEVDAGCVSVFPGCLVEYRSTQVGHDLVEVYERNGIECANAAAGCCGAPWLHNGHVDQFAWVATANVRSLARQIRDGGADIIVAEPTCGHVVKHEYVRHVDERSRGDAELVAQHTFDASEYLMRLHAEGRLDTDFGGAVPERITYVPAAHLLAQRIGEPARELLELTGVDVRGSDDGTRDAVVASDASLAAETATHPISIVARAYGIDPA